MNATFGARVGLFAGDAEDGTAVTTPEEDMALVRQTLTAFNEGGPGFLRIYRPKPTAAFAPRDTTVPQYSAAVDSVRALGFAPVERRAGGQLAIYDSNALVIDWVAPHADPRLHVIERYRHFSGALVAALKALAIDAGIGALEGEYCPGDYSVNGEGRVKLAGVAQRIGRSGFHIGAVISVRNSTVARTAVAEAYRILDIPFDPRTFGAIEAMNGAVSFAEVRAALLMAIGEI